MKDIQTFSDRVFESGVLPVLVNANRQDYGKAKHDRPMHGHDSMCELLLCYRGFGTYNVNDFSYMIQEGDLIYYNCGELHEVVSNTDMEIGTYCFGFSSVQFRGLPVNHCIPSSSPHVRASQAQFPFLRNLAEQILALNDAAADRPDARHLSAHAGGANARHPAGQRCAQLRLPAHPPHQGLY